MATPQPDDVVDPDRTIVFDLYGVLALHQDPAGQRVIESLLGVTDGRARLWDAYWERRPGYDRGDVDAGDWWSAVGGDLSRTVTAALAERLVAADVASWSRLDPAMVEVAGRLLDQGRELALLSNAPLEIATEVRSRAPWLSRFAAVVFSAEARAAKPEAAAFAAVETALGRQPGQLLMVDDRTENVAAARDRGWAGLRFTGRSAFVAALGSDLGPASGSPTDPGRDARSR